MERLNKQCSDVHLAASSDVVFLLHKVKLCSAKDYFTVSSFKVCDRLRSWFMLSSYFC